MGMNRREFTRAGALVGAGAVATGVAGSCRGRACSNAAGTCPRNGQAGREAALDHGDRQAPATAHRWATRGSATSVCTGSKLGNCPSALPHASAGRRILAMPKIQCTRGKVSSVSKLDMAASPTCPATSVITSVSSPTPPQRHTS